MVQHHWWKNVFLTHFSPIFGPKTAHIQGILGFSMRQNASPQASKWAENTCLSIPNGPTSLLEKPVLDPFVTHHFGIYHGPQRVTMGSKWAKNTCLGIPNGPTSLLEKRVLTHFWSQNGPFSSHFGIFHGLKRVTTGSKWAENTCFSIPNGPTSVLEKRGFDPCWTHFWSQSVPFSRHLGIFHGPKRVTTS